MPRKNDWASRFGVARRAKDRAYCEAAERALVAEELAKPTKIDQSWGDADTRVAIARAFGRPIN